MLPGPDHIIACPHCEGLARHQTLLSGNTFGAANWTDGKQDAPMLPRLPPLVRCQHCQGFFWLSDARKVSDLPWIEEPSAEEYELALRQGLAQNGEQERSLRVLLWWRRNDPRRHMEKRPSPWQLAPEERANLEALLPLLDDRDESDQLMRAEILRELGRFQEAVQALPEIKGTGPLAGVVDQIRSLCIKEEPRVTVFATGKRRS